MRVLNWEQFAALKGHVVFSFFEPRICEGLMVKGETLYGTPGFADDPSKPIDFLYQDLIPDCDGDDQVPSLSDDLSRWGLFEYDQLFAVFDPEDINQLIRMAGG